MGIQSDKSKQVKETGLEGVPGAEPSARIDAWWWLVAGVVALILLMVFLVPDPYRRIVIFVRDGVWVTVYVTILSFFFTLILGLIGGLGRLSKNRGIHAVATLYVELIRGIPLLVQLIWWYFAFPVIVQALGRATGLQGLVSYQASAVPMAIMGLTFCYGAYMSEIYRAGIQSIPFRADGGSQKSGDELLPGHAFGHSAAGHPGDYAAHGQ